MLVFLTTSGCHLCEDAKVMLAALQRETGLGVTEVDIASDDVLVERYGLRIPVLRAGDRELDWPFAAADILELVAD